MAERGSRIAERALLLTGTAVVCLTFRDYGSTWDEFVQSRYGELVLAYFGSGFQDRRCNTFADLFYYGPLFEALAAVAYEWAGVFKLEIRHLLTALTGILAVWGTIRFARLFSGGTRLPLFAGAALLLWPRFYGHSFVNSKDVPFACAFVWAMVAIARWSLAGGGRRPTLLAGLAIGLALALRPGGVVVFGFLGFAALPLLRQQEHRRRVVAQLAAAVALGWSVMVASWPWAHESPLLHPLQAMQVSFRFPHPFPNLFEGRWITADSLPWNYVPKWLAITTPDAFLLLGAVGVLVAAAAALREPRWAPPAMLAQLTLLWVFAPLAFVLVRRPPLYDEVRHFLFILPGAAVLVGSGLDLLIRLAEPRIGRLAWGLALVLLSPLPDLILLHPYQMTYFNRFAHAGGGLLSERYDTDYWLSSYREAIEWVNRQPIAPGRRRHVLVAASPGFHAAADYAAPHVVAAPASAFAREATLPEGFDTYIGTTRFFLHGLYPDVPIVHIIAREGMVLAVVRSSVDPPLVR